MDTDLKYLTRNILTDAHCLLPNTVMPLKFDGLNFDGLAGKHQKRHNFPPIKILRCVYGISVRPLIAVLQNTNIYMYIRTYVCMYVCMCVCIYVCTYVCM